MSIAAGETSGNDENKGSTRKGLNVLAHYLASGWHRRLFTFKPFGLNLMTLP